MLLCVGWMDNAARVPLALQARGMGLSTYPLCIEVPQRLLDPCPIKPTPSIPGMV